MEDLFMKQFKEFAVNYNSIISHLFYGILEAKSQCMGRCNSIKFNFQVYSFIEFPLEKVINAERKINNNKILILIYLNVLNIT